MSRYNGHIYNTILCFGDSLTQRGWNIQQHGWVAQMAHAYLRRLDILNRGFSGFNSRWAKHLLPQILPPTAISQNSSQIKSMTLWFGSNDAQFSGYKCHVPLDEFKENLQSLIDMVKDPVSTTYSETIKIIMLTPTPVDDKMWAQRMLEEENIAVPDRCYQTTLKYTEVVRQVAQQNNLPLVDVWNEMVDQKEKYLMDGLHLNREGNDLVFELLMGCVKDNYPELYPDNIPFVVPDYRTFDGTPDDIEQLMKL